VFTTIQKFSLTDEAPTAPSGFDTRIDPNTGQITKDLA
jgi:hypothetical protein